jgi:hypothetical protein
MCGVFIRWERYLLAVECLPVGGRGSLLELQLGDLLPNGSQVIDLFCLNGIDLISIPLGLKENEFLGQTVDQALPPFAPRVGFYLGDQGGNDLLVLRSLQC